MYLNKANLFLVISICLIFFFLTYNDVKSQELKIISGIAKVVDGDTIKIGKNKIRLLGIDAPEKKQQCQKPWLSIFFLIRSKFSLYLSKINKSSFIKTIFFGISLLQFLIAKDVTR